MYLVEAIIYMGISFVVITIPFLFFKFSVRTIYRLKKIASILGGIGIALTFVGVGYMLIYKSLPMNTIVYYLVLTWFACGFIGLLPYHLRSTNQE
jgi:hypothetical protein